MVNDYALVPTSGDASVLDVIVSEKTVGQVGVTNGAWRFRLDSTAPWSTDTFGSEFEASEFVLVERGLLRVGPGGVVVSSVKTGK